MLIEKEVEKLLPRNINFKYKLAVKSLIVHKAPFEYVCLGCGIQTEEEIELLQNLLVPFNYKIPANYQIPAS